MSALLIPFRRCRIAAVTASVVGLVFSMASAPAATKDAGTKDAGTRGAGTKDAGTRGAEEHEAASLVREALHRDLYGLQAEREQLLATAARRAPEYGPANWHRGYVRTASGWESVTELVEQSVNTAAEKEYPLRREKLVDTVDGQLRLANWCRERGLAPQERAHLSRILELSPEQPGIRERLGMQWIRGQWLNRDEAGAARERFAKEAAAGARWRPELRQIGAGLKHANPAHRETARARLKAIHDPHVIPAMETLLSANSEECALAVLDVVAEIPGQEATDSLVRHAVFSEILLVRAAAAERLRTRQQESFVPELIAEMNAPVASQFQWAQLRNGRFGYRHLVQQEQAEQRDVLILDTVYVRAERPGADVRETLQRAFLDSLLGAAQREFAVSQRNALQAAVNQRLTAALNIATGQQLPADPQRWWQWWDQENDVARQGNKQTRLSQQTRQVSIVDRRPQFDAPTGRQTTGPQQRAECFAAGTKVLTRRGPAPIEKLLAGDLVLSQNPNTGELVFKPVLGTTVRPAGKLVKIRVGRDAFETSQGHLYWVAGEGWRKARQLDSGMQLHCLRGLQPISCVEEGAEAPTYNLVVADFHTYFVGDEQVLSHDVTIRRPTSAIVPGLSNAD